MKNKGFMLIETLIASTVIMGALVFLFIQFSTIKKSYENSFKYNTVPGLYNGKILADFISTNGTTNLDSSLSNSTKGYIILNNNCTLGGWNSTKTKLCDSIISSINVNHILYVGNNISNLQNDIKNDNYDPNVFMSGLMKFILSLEPIESKERKRLIIAYKNDTYAVITIN